MNSNETKLKTKFNFDELIDRETSNSVKHDKGFFPMDPNFFQHNNNILGLKRILFGEFAENATPCK